jgi:hypothetical protein
LAAKVREVADLGKAATSSNKELSEALAKAKQETEEAIQAGNKKYNEMVAQYMRKEDETSERIQVCEWVVVKGVHTHQVHKMYNMGGHLGLWLHGCCPVSERFLYCCI